MQDSIVKCRRCQTDFCYEVTNPGVSVSWSCMMCGFTTSTYMMENTAELKAYLKAIPPFYQSLQFKDSEGFIWIPPYRTVEGVGEIFAEPLADGDWCWSFVPYVPLSAKDNKELYRNRDGSYRDYKADMSQIKRYHKDAFSSALAGAGLLGDY